MSKPVGTDYTKGGIVMSNTIDDGGAVFPHEQIIYGRQGNPPGEPVYHQGMSLRAYFIGNLLSNISPYSYDGCDPKGIARTAREIADAAIEELEM